jgi:ATP-dependent Lon protease
LGGGRDEAEIRGHRRTYIWRYAGPHFANHSARPKPRIHVFMLDEIDKMGQDYRGDPASALLEVLGSRAKFYYSDHYLELSFDLSQVMLLLQRPNIQDTIPPALLDRMEIIEFPGYTEEEKIQIAKRFLIPRQLEESGLDEKSIQFSAKSLQKVIREYTYEAGVRNLEREIGRICRKVARLKAGGKAFPHHITHSIIERFLGPPQFFDLDAERQDEVGVATALAWSPNGGEIMPVEGIADVRAKETCRLLAKLGM